MEIGNILYIRTDYKIEDTTTTEKDITAHLTYLESVADKRFFMGGGYVKKPGGMIIFEACDIEEAHRICQQDPLIIKGLYRYDLLEWELAILSKEQ